MGRGLCLFLVLMIVPSLFAQISWTEQQFLNTNATTDSEIDNRATLATDGNGTWVAVWSSEEDLAGSGGDSDLFFSCSIDNGITWTDPDWLNTNAGSDSGFDTRPHIAFGMNRFIVVWSSNEDLGGIGTDGDLFISVSTDLGVTWTSPEVLNQGADLDTQFDWDPYIATNGVGNWMVGWYTNEDLDGSGDDTDIFLITSPNNGATWTAPAVLTEFMRNDSGSDFSPRISSDGAGVWGLVFQSPNDLNDTVGTDNDVMYMRSLDNGFSWSLPNPINSDAESDDSNDDGQFIINDGNGNWIIAWSSDDHLIEGIDQDIWISRSSDDGLTWSDQINVTGDSDVGSDFSPHLATDGAGTWTAVWWSLTTETRILSSYSLDEGQTWSQSIPVRQDGDAKNESDSGPVIASDGDGNLVTVWEGFMPPDGGNDRDILVATSGPVPDCILPQSFYDRLPEWPGLDAPAFVEMVNLECDLTP